MLVGIVAVQPPLGQCLWLTGQAASVAVRVKERATILGALVLDEGDGAVGVGEELAHR